MPDGSGARPRVVSLIASGTEIVAALGMGQRLVGRSHSCDYPNWVKRLPILTKPKVDPDAPSSEIDAAVRRLVSSSHSVYEIDSDGLARLRPEVIVTQDQCEVCAVSLRDVEEAVLCLAMPEVEICTLLPRDLADVRRDFLRVAKALGVPERGEALLGRFDARLQQLRDRARRLPIRRLVMIEWLDPPMVAGGWMPELARIAGAEPLLIDEGERPHGGVEGDRRRRPRSCSDHALWLWPSADARGVGGSRSAPRAQDGNGGARRPVHHSGRRKLPEPPGATPS